MTRPAHRPFWGREARVLIGSSAIHEVAITHRLFWGREARVTIRRACAYAWCSRACSDGYLPLS